MTVATADIHIKVDPQVKREAEKNFAKCGITMTRFINDVLRSFNRDFKENRTEIEKYSVPENLRIETREQLVNILQKRIADDDGTYYSVDEAKQIVMGGESGATGEKI